MRQSTHNQSHRFRLFQSHNLRTLQARNVTNFRAPADTKKAASTKQAVTKFTEKYTPRITLLVEGEAEMKLDLACSVGVYEEFRPTQNTWVSILTQKLCSKNVVNTEEETC
jgi:hypothetical protein